jgi:hypothetical protein
MNPRNLSFRRIPDDETDFGEQMSSDHLEKAPDSNDQISSGVTFRRYNDPKKVKELLEIGNFKELLGRSYLFIQNRKLSSNRLLRQNLDEVWTLFDYAVINATSGNADSIFRSLEVRNLLSLFFSRIKRGSQKYKPKVFIINVGGKAQANQFCKRMSKIKTPDFGIWVRGYLWDLEPYVLSQFDAMFLFDMAGREYEILRSAIDVSSDLIEDLKKAPSGLISDKKVLFFLNAERVKDAPLMLQNPVILDR